MKITCDNCDTQIELDKDPGQLNTAACRCTHCHANLAAPAGDVSAAGAGSDLSSPKTPNTKMDFLRTDMPGKKRKKKNVSEGLNTDPAPRREANPRPSHPAGPALSPVNAASPKPVAGGLPDPDDPFDFLADEADKSMAGDMLNEKTEVLGIDDVEFNPGKGASGDKGDPGRDGSAGEGSLFLDFDLEGLGLDGDVIRRIDNAEESDDPDDMKPFTLDLEEEFSAVSEDETIVLDLDLDGRSERFRPAGDKKPVDAVSGAATAGVRAGLPSEEPAAVSTDLDGRFSATGRDGLLDLFLDLDQGQGSSGSRGKTFAEEAGLLQMDNGDFIVEGEDPQNLPLDLRSLKKELDARDTPDGQEDFLELDLGLDDPDGGSASGHVGLGLDENLLLDLDLDFDEEEEGAAAGYRGATPGDSELEGDENPFMDLDLDLDEVEGAAAADPARGPAMASAPEEEDLLEDLDLDFDEDEQGLATIVADAGLNRDSEGGTSPGGLDMSLDEDLLLDLDLDDEKEMAAQEEAEAEAAVLDPNPMTPPTALSALREEAFSLDLDLDLDEDAPEAGLSNAEVLDLDLDLSLEPEGEAASVSAAPEDDFSLELDLDDGPEEAALSAAEEDVLDLDLSLEPEGEAAAVSAAPEEDFSLELDLDEGLKEAALSAADAEEDAPALALSPEPATAGEPPSADGEDEFSLELELDDGSEEAALSEAEEDSPALGLDLSSESEGGGAAVSAAPEEEFSLELDLDDGSAEEEDGSREEPVKATGPEEDLALELAPEDAADLASVDGAERAEAPATEADEMLKAVDADAESDEDFLFNMELEKFEEAPDALETAPVAESVEPGEGGEPERKSSFPHEPESFEVVEEILLSSDPESKPQGAEHRDEDFIDAFDMGIPTNEFEELNEHPPETKKPQGAQAPAMAAGALIAAGAFRGRRRLGMSVWILALALLGALLFGAYSFGLFEGANATHILRRIPFLGDYIAAPVNPAGEVTALENTIKHRFVENKVTGTLFVITGKVRNDSPGPRSHIKVIGMLSAPGKKNAGKEIVYCGNTLTDEELTTLPPDRIKAILAQQAGKNNSNVNVPPGKVVPYMIVFDDPPATPEALSVMVKESMPSAG